MRFSLLLLLVVVSACGRTRVYEPTCWQLGCDDGIACTTDVCQRDGTCRHDADDAACEVDDFCRVDARCDLRLGCQWSARDCSNTLSCDTDTCDELTRSCRHMNACPSGKVCSASGCIDCVMDSDCSDGAECTADTCEAGRCEHRLAPALCDDGAACTIDTCGADGRCAHAPDDSVCADGVPCTADRCMNGACVHTPDNMQCSDGVFCNGDEVCGPMGCAAGPPRVCADTLACTVDSCEEAGKRCVAQPDDSLCPAGQLCGTAGCGVFAYAVTDDGLYDVQLPSGVATRIATTTFADAGSIIGLTDIALDPNGTLYGSSDVFLMRVDRFTGRVTPLHTLGARMNALDVLPGGELYGSGGNTVSSINRASGVRSTVATLPAGFSASGDLAVVSQRIYLTVVGPGSANDRLAEVVTDGGASRIIGDTGARCVWGLAAYGPKLYGFDCEGRVLLIDVTTGAGTELAKNGLRYFGASAR